MRKAKVGLQHKNME